MQTPLQKIKKLLFFAFQVQCKDANKKGCRDSILKTPAGISTDHAAGLIALFSTICTLPKPPSPIESLTKSVKI